MIFEVGRAVGHQTAAISDLKRDLELPLSELKRNLSEIKCEMNDSLEGISEKLTVLQRRMDRMEDQNGQIK